MNGVFPSPGMTWRLERVTDQQLLKFQRVGSKEIADSGVFIGQAQVGMQVRTAQIEIDGDGFVSSFRQGEGQVGRR